MPIKPIAVIGSIDSNRPEFNPPLKNIAQAQGACRALGSALADAGRPILVFSSSPEFLEAFVVQGYIRSNKANPKSITMLYPRNKDPRIHGDFAEQATHASLFEPLTDNHPRWEASFYQSLPDVEGILLVGGYHATLIIGLMALATKTPIVSLATFGGSAEEIWAMLNEKQWIEVADRQEMARGSWSDDSAPKLVASLARQRDKLNEIQQEKKLVVAKQQMERRKRSRWALIYGVISAALTLLGVFGSVAVFGERVWLIVYAICFAAIPVCSGMAGSMFYTLRRAAVCPPSIEEAQAHGFWAGLGSAVLFFVSQVTSNRGISSLHTAVVKGEGGLDILLLFSLTIAFIAGLTYEAVFGKWETVDASRSARFETRIGQ